MEFWARMILPRYKVFGTISASGGGMKTKKNYGLATYPGQTRYGHIRHS